MSEIKYYVGLAVIVGSFLLEYRAVTKKDWAQATFWLLNMVFIIYCNN